MDLVTVAVTVVFLGVLALSLLAVLDVISFRPDSKRTNKSGRQSTVNARREARMARKEALASHKSDRRS